MDDHWTQARELSCSCSFLDTGEYELKLVEVGVFILKQGLDSNMNKDGYQGVIITKTMIGTYTSDYDSDFISFHKGMHR